MARSRRLIPPPSRLRLSDLQMVLAHGLEPMIDHTKGNTRGQLAARCLQRGELRQATRIGAQASRPERTSATKIACASTAREPGLGGLRRRHGTMRRAGTPRVSYARARCRGRHRRRRRHRPGTTTPEPLLLRRLHARHFPRLRRTWCTTCRAVARSRAAPSANHR